MKAIALNSSTVRLSTAFLFSKIGEFSFEAAFAVTVVRLTDADLLLIGIIYFFRYMPSLIFSPLGGWLADNRIKKNILIGAELLKALAAFAMFFIVEFWQASLGAIVLLAMIMTAADCLFTPTFRAYFPEIVETDQLPSLNSGLQAIEDCSSIIGPLIFVVISTLIFPSANFLLFALCLLASTAWILRLRAIPPANLMSFDGATVFRQALRGIGHMRRTNAPLFTVICCTTLCAIFATSILRFILPAAVIEHFQSEAAVGYILSLLAAGTVLGSILYEKINATTTVGSVVKYWGIYGCLLLASSLTLQVNTYVFITILFTAGFIGAFVDIAIVTNIQSLSRQQEVGRNFSIYYFTAVIGDALSGLIASLVFLIAGPATLMGMTFLLALAPLGWRTKQGGTGE